MIKIIRTLRHWRQGIRLYIAILIALISVEVFWWASAAYPESSVAAIRLQETYGYLSLVFLGIALAVGPAYKLFPGLPGKLLMRDARRMLGIGAGWFATLHAGIAYFVQFQAAPPSSLPGTFQQAFLFGLAALVILWLMAFTSFDAAFRRLGAWWLRLHRLVYVAVFLALLHIFMIGVHATNLLAVVLLGGFVLFIIILHICIAAGAKRL